MNQECSKDQTIHNDQSVLNLLQRASDRRCTLSASGELRSSVLWRVSAARHQPPVSN
ncbi:hypothetical protein JZO77_04575 [Enterococcus hulanensis]|uniref:hypothetical protein n=1 Tax=Enterococcus hulanensis TaxID=2559929 RepID=UPI001A90A84E|nr:hypothetical protein [Enterococcus hulanensis]MBO0456011.1 hypothetical protein [Enterococcus hulanensis]